MGHHEEGHDHEEKTGIFFEETTAGFDWIYVIGALAVISLVVFL